MLSKSSNKQSDICAVDIGNSRIKALAHQNRGSAYVEYFASEYDYDWLRNFKKFLKELPGEFILAYSSVKPSALEQALGIAGKFKNNTIYSADFILEKQNILQYGNIKGIGYDRLFGLIGAMRGNEPPLITVDCGTAVTVNTVDKKGDCLGGAIFAGLNTQAQALSQNAEALKDIDIKTPHTVAGQNTCDAMRSGIIFSVVGGIKDICNRIISEEFNSKSVPFVITGGGGELISEILNEDGFENTYERNLVLNGIISAVQSIGL